jgi:hypothetical protein
VVPSCPFLARSNKAVVKFILSNTISSEQKLQSGPVLGKEEGEIVTLNMWILEDVWSSTLGCAEMLRTRTSYVQLRKEPTKERKPPGTGGSRL